MNQSLLLPFVVAILGSAHPAYAQNRLQFVAQTTPAGITDLYQRYQECIGNSSCDVQKHLQLMIDMTDGMHQSLGRMNQTCTNMNYQDCIGVQANEKRQWKIMHNYMNALMQDLDPEYKESMLDNNRDNTAIMMNTKEPDVPDNYKNTVQQKKNWWQDIWNNKKEPVIDKE
ncbi:MAG: hypothetical protein CO093_06845 [Alphaproteobacteria bacterium CG_4_9_14_3_um_filter_47_13]|nr:MAG: hypothetical protein CO093_06845 [Alphaproteobacteria bacterium CG_4_9_14_3_um_filter_47_13]